MKILFKNKTKYTKEIYKEFVEFHNKKYSFQYTLFNIFIIALLLFFIICQIKYEYYVLAIISCIVFTVFCLYRYFHPISVVKKELNGNTIKKEKSFTFKFYDKHFIIQDSSISNLVKYYKLRRCFETKDFFYLYIDKTHAFLINKENFSIGNSSDFSKFIRKKCFLRFKKIK